MHGMGFPWSMVGCPGIFSLLNLSSFDLLGPFVTLALRPAWSYLCFRPLLSPFSLLSQFLTFFALTSHKRILCLLLTMVLMFSCVSLFLPMFAGTFFLSNDDNVLANILSGHNPIAFNMADPLPLFLVQVKYYFPSNMPNYSRMQSKWTLTWHIRLLDKIFLQSIQWTDKNDITRLFSNTTFAILHRR